MKLDARLFDHEGTAMYSDDVMQHQSVLAGLVIAECLPAASGQATILNYRRVGHDAVLAHALANFFVNNTGLKEMVDGMLAAHAARIRFLGGGQR